MSPMRMNLRAGKVWKRRVRESCRALRITLGSEMLRGRMSKDPGG